MRRLSRNRKAVSNVIGTILMILVVVVGMSMAFGYFVNFVKDYQTGRGASVTELISLEDVWFRTGGDVTIWLYNYGKVDVTVSTFYVNGQSIDFNSMSVSVGNHNYTTTHITDQEWVAGVTSYHFKLVTERGSVFEGNYTVPIM